MSRRSSAVLGGRKVQECEGAHLIRAGLTAHKDRPRRKTRTPTLHRAPSAWRAKPRIVLAGLVGLWAVCGTCLAFAAPPHPAPTDEVLGHSGGLIVLLAAVSLLPFAFMTLTAFIKISTVLQIVRGAIGAQNVPSNTVVMALAAALSVIAMYPVGARIADRAEPILRDSASRDTGALVIGLIDAAREPMRGFLAANASNSERARFLEVARSSRAPADRASVTDRDFVVIIPSFMITELYEAFALGFAIYLPFLVVDLVVANVLLALGMQMLNPTQVSLPFKLLLFVAVDGWGLLARALVRGYAPG